MPPKRRSPKRSRPRSPKRSRRSKSSRRSGARRRYRATDWVKQHAANAQGFLGDKTKEIADETQLGVRRQARYHLDTENAWVVAQFPTVVTSLPESTKEVTITLPGKQTYKLTAKDQNRIDISFENGTKDATAIENWFKAQRAVNKTEGDDPVPIGITFVEAVEANMIGFGADNMHVDLEKPFSSLVSTDLIRSLRTVQCQPVGDPKDKKFDCSNGGVVSFGN